MLVSKIIFGVYLYLGKWSNLTKKIWIGLKPSSSQHSGALLLKSPKFHFRIEWWNSERQSTFPQQISIPTSPIGSMYGIFTYIWLICMVNVGKYSIHGSYRSKQHQILLCFNGRRISRWERILRELQISSPSDLGRWSRKSGSQVQNMWDLFGCWLSTILCGCDSANGIV